MKNIYHMIGQSGRIPTPVNGPQEESETNEHTVLGSGSAMNSTGSNYIEYQVKVIDTNFTC